MSDNLSGQIDLEEEKTWVVVVHVLYLAAFVTGITAIVGVVLAYLRKDSASEWAYGHYVYAIRTFWIGLLALIITFLLCFVLIGFILIPLVAVWFILRSVLPLVKATRGEALANPETWWI